MKWISIYGVVGLIVLTILWRILSIDWKTENINVKIILMITPLLWPMIVLFIVVEKIKNKF